VDLDELFDAHFGVNLRGLESLVAEELLDKADVAPAFEHVGGAAVAKEMATAAPPDVGGLDVFRDSAAEHIRVEGLSVARQKQRSRLRPENEQGPHVDQIPFESEQGAFAHRNDAVLATLALAHLGGATFLVDRGEFQPGQSTIS